MRHDDSFQQTIDPVLGRHLLNASWLSAGLGVSTFQMLVLAQAWQLSGRAVVPACMVSIWLLGSLFGARLPINARMWGRCLLLSMLLWLGGTRLVTWHLPLLPQAMAQLCPFAVGAFVLGSTSSAWHTPRPGWPSVGERTTLCRGLISTTAGLVIVWLLPTWSPLVGLVCLLPLLVLDALPDARRPLSSAGSVLDGWVGRYWTTNRWQPQLQGRGWRNWSSLAVCALDAKQYLYLTLLASSTAVILGAVWGAVPTPFAGGLVATHTLFKLGWLLMSQVVVLTIAASCLPAARGVVGFPNRLLPASWRPRALSLAVLMLFLMGGSLVTLGLRALQAPWWLALSLACYTAAAAVWGILLPRLRPNPSTVLFAYRHLLAGHAQMDYPQLAYERAQEEGITRMLTTLESLCITVLTPAMGWLIDVLGSVDTVLILVGLLFVLLLSLVLLVTHVLSGLHQARSQTFVMAKRGRAGYSWTCGASSIRFAS
jgi:hypothetical protein